MPKKQSVYLTHDGILTIDGKEYIGSIAKTKKIDGIEHIDKQLFTEFNREEYEKKINFIAKRIKDSLEKDEVIKELVKKRALNEIDRLYKIMKEDKKQKKKITKQKGCLGLKIGTGKHKTGGAYLELID